MKEGPFLGLKPRVPGEDMLRVLAATSQSAQGLNTSITRPLDFCLTLEIVVHSEEERRQVELPPEGQFSLALVASRSLTGLPAPDADQHSNEFNKAGTCLCGAHLRFGNISCRSLRRRAGSIEISLSVSVAAFTPEDHKFSTERFPPPSAIRH